MVLFLCSLNFKRAHFNYNLEILSGLQKIFLGTWPSKELYSLSFAIPFYFSVHFSSAQWEAMFLWGLKRINKWRRFWSILKNYYFIIIIIKSVQWVHNYNQCIWHIPMKCTPLTRMLPGLYLSAYKTFCMKCSSTGSKTLGLMPWESVAMLKCPCLSQRSQFI